MNIAQLLNRLTTYVVNIVTKMHFQTISTPRYLKESEWVLLGELLIYYSVRRHQWSRSLRCGSAAACLLGLRVRILSRELMPAL